MKKKILTILSVFSIVASLTACNSATEAVKEPETAKNWEVSTYYMNGYYNPETKELTTVDAAGNCDIWDNIEIRIQMKTTKFLCGQKSAQTARSQ